MAIDDVTALDAVFRPKRIAVLGASSEPGKFGHSLVKNLQGFNFPGEIYPISKSAPEICGFKTYPSLHDLPNEIDLVLVSIPAPAVPAGIAEAGAIAAKAAVVFTAGFQEIGEEGRKLQEETIARAAGQIRMIGPNCLGIRNFHLPMNASPVAQAGHDAGPIAFVSQSGAFGNGAVMALRNLRIGLSKLASIGNMADLTHAHLFRYLADDPETKVIATFVEGVPDVPFFLDTIAEVSRKKPILILKGGRSKTGQRAALSHTGSLAGDGRVWESLVREAGGIFVDSSEELFDTAMGLAHAGDKLPRGRRTSIFSLAGGPGVVGADHCEAAGLSLPPLEDALQSLRPIVPPFAALGNPVEVTGQTRREHMHTCAQAVINQPNVDSMIGIALGLDFPEFAQSLIEAKKTKPVVACVVAPHSEAMFGQAGLANYPSVDRAVRVLRNMVERAETLARPPLPLPAAADQRPLRTGVHSEAESKAYLASYGLPVTREEVVKTAEAAVTAADRIGYPVALKVSSAGIAHKSDAGGVILNLKDAAALRTAVKLMDERFPGEAMLVQQMVPGGVELIVGAQRMRATGAVLMLGIGGIFAEVLDDVVFCRAPASEAAVRAALKRLRTQRLLDGYRGLPPIDREAVAAIGARLSEIVAANPSIAEVDLNPVFAHASGAIIVDALIRVEGA